MKYPEVFFVWMTGALERGLLGSHPVSSRLNGMFHKNLGKKLEKVRMDRDFSYMIYYLC